MLQSGMAQWSAVCQRTHREHEAEHVCGKCERGDLQGPAKTKIGRAQLAAEYEEVT